MKTTSIYTFFFALVFLLGCSKSETPPSGMGSLSIKLTDAPFPHDMVAEANVTIFKIEARYRDENADEDEDQDYGDGDSYDDDDSGKKFVVLMEEEFTVNLLNLTNGITETLVDTNIPAGVYDLFRVYVRDANIVLNDEDNTTYDLKFPSGEQSGVKVFIDPPLVVTTGLSADLLFDFDVCRSFVARGNIKNPQSFNGFIFKPVIKVSNLTTSGTLQGMVATQGETEIIALEGAQISVLQDGEVIRNTFSGDTGGYVLEGMEPGIYSILVEAEGFVSQTVENIQVAVGNATTQDFELVPSE
jgi:hypothetical protein